VACRSGLDAVNRLQVLTPEELVRIFHLPTDEIFVEQVREPNNEIRRGKKGNGRKQIERNNVNQIEIDPAQVKRNVGSL
jgi:hypothetical protein